MINQAYSPSGLSPKTIDMISCALRLFVGRFIIPLPSTHKRDRLLSCQLEG